MLVSAVLVSDSVYMHDMDWTHGRQDRKILKIYISYWNLFYW